MWLYTEPDYSGTKVIGAPVVNDPPCYYGWYDILSSFPNAHAAHMLSGPTTSNPSGSITVLLESITHAASTGTFRHPVTRYGKALACRSSQMIPKRDKHLKCRCTSFSCTNFGNRSVKDCTKDSPVYYYFTSSRSDLLEFRDEIQAYKCWPGMQGVPPDRITARGDRLVWSGDTRVVSNLPTTLCTMFRCLIWSSLIRFWIELTMCLLTLLAYTL